MDADDLFVKYTVEEIRKIEKNTRSDIEKKKEDLRQMVGERYRDLIEAADTITEMKNCSVKILTSVQDLQKHCVNLQKTMMIRGMAGAASQNQKEIESKKKFYAISSEIKLLVDIPDRIWSALEGGHHLEATQLYLIACHVTSSLQLDSSTPQSAQILKWFPVLSRQWATLSHFKQNILQSSRNILKDFSMSDQKTAEALCSILLLEDSSPRQVFAEFLLARKSAIQSCLTPDLHNTSVKTQVCTVTSVAERTLRQIHSIFYNDEESGDSSSLLFDILSAVCDSHLQGKPGPYHIKLEVGNFGKYLPTHIKDFRPVLAAPATPIATSYLQQSVNQWVETCIGDVQHGVSKFLRHITTIKALTGIRDAVYELLEETEDDRASWKSVCEKVLKRRLSLWSEFLRSLFITRIQAIIQDSLDETVSETQRLISEATEKLEDSPEERNICSYIWRESGLDIPSEAAWDRGITTKKPLESGGLYMKTKAYTPQNQSICSALDNRVSVLLEDLANYTSESQPSQQRDKDLELVRTPPFDRYADNTTLFSFMQITSVRSTTKLCEFLKAQLLSCKVSLESLENTRQEEKPKIVDRALLLGRLCGSVVELCTSLKKAICIADIKESKADAVRSRSRLKRQSTSGDVLPEEKEWFSLVKVFQEQSEEAFKLWSNVTCSTLLEEFKFNLTDMSPSSTLKIITKWDKIEIQEETDDGKKVTSTILLPVQSSWYVQCLLFGLCEEISRIGGHALSRVTVSALIQDISQGLITCYQEHLKELQKGKDTLHQAQALQWVFDVRFFTSVMSGRGEDKKVNAAYQKQLKSVIDTLEGYIDPFDLDVFHPHLQQKLNSHCQRCSLLMGALTNPNKHLLSSHRAASSTYQEQHNVLPVAGSQLRFNLLPLSTVQGSALPAVQPAIPRIDPEPHKSKTRSPSTPNLFGSAGFHKSQTVPASLSSKFESLKTGWLSNLGVQSK
ncbi:Conserved oligomeric Golgi complex subunit 1 [Holothuria leucospilota]|uniref:Conserved oligomeric Golgi complex subunit 1 n=1 Tax=Holothuria leucospilota TaxID=206669 RepID=A0A9Q1BLY5_HOLLE|nr:Conserved oligomeric Golgi complex subunit 1 [Holothuria leucospilota]